MNANVSCLSACPCMCVVVLSECAGAGSPTPTYYKKIQSFLVAGYGSVEVKFKN